MAKTKIAMLRQAADAVNNERAAKVEVGARLWYSWAGAQAGAWVTVVSLRSKEDAVVKIEEAIDEQRYPNAYFAKKYIVGNTVEVKRFHLYTSREEAA